MDLECLILPAKVLSWLIIAQEKINMDLPRIKCSLQFGSPGVEQQCMRECHTLLRSLISNSLHHFWTVCLWLKGYNDVLSGKIKCRVLLEAKSSILWPSKPKWQEKEQMKELNTPPSPTPQWMLLLQAEKITPQKNSLAFLSNKFQLVASSTLERPVDVT